MKKYLILFAALVLVIQACDKDEISPNQAGSFVKYYGSRLKDYGNNVAQLPDGGYVIAGTISTADSMLNICLIFTDKFGNSVKGIKSYGGVFDDRVSDMILLPDGGVALVGSIQKTRAGTTDIFAIRTNSGGDTIWTRQFGGSGNDEGNSLIFDDNSLILVGYSQKTSGTQDKDPWLCKVDLNGNKVWERGRSYEGDNVVTGIVKTNDGFIVMGTTIGGFEIYGVDKDVNSILLYKIGLFGVENASPSFITSSESYTGSMIHVAPDGGFIILGTATNSTGKTDILLTKVSSTLAIANGFPKFISSGGSLTGKSLLVSDNKLHIFGTNSLSTGLSTMILYTTDIDGYVLNHKEFSFLKEVEGLGFDITEDGGYVLTGGSTKTDNSEIVIIKTKAGGIL